MPEPLLKTYDGKQLVAEFGGQLITGWGQEQVRIRRLSPIAEDESGADMETVRYLTNDRRGDMTFTLQQSSKSNLFLNSTALIDENTGLGVRPLLVKDLLSGDIWSAPTSWIREYPEAIRSKGVNVQGWLIRTNNLIMGLAGAEAV